MRYSYDIVEQEHHTSRWLTAFAIAIPLAVIGFLIALYLVYR